jgi:hypothetical protein
MYGLKAVPFKNLSFSAACKAVPGSWTGRALGFSAYATTLAR